MADPLSVAASVISLVELATQILSIVAVLRENTHAIEANELMNELRSFVAVLGVVTDLLSANYQISYYDAIGHELASASLTAYEIDRTLQKIVPTELGGGVANKGTLKKAMVRLKYVAKKEKLAKLQGNIRHHTSSLGVMLNAAQMYIFIISTSVTR